MTNLVVAYAVDFQFDPLLSVAVGLLIVSSKGFGCLSCSAPVTDCVGSWAALSGLRRIMIR